MSISQYINENHGDIVLSNSPLIDTVCDLRYNSNLSRDSFLSKIFDELNKRGYTEFKTLEINNLPEILIENDPSINYKPRYSFSNKYFLVQVGPSNMVFSSILKEWQFYQWWEHFSTELFHIIDLINRTTWVSEFDRFWLRFVNFFIWKDIMDWKISKIWLNLDWNSLTWDKYHIQSSFDQSWFTCNLTISNTIILANQDTWSIVDIDFTKTSLALKNIKSDLDLSHKLLKNVFLSIVDNGFLTTYK